MSGNSAKVREKSGKRPKVRERSGNLCSQINLIVAAEQNNLPVLYLYCNVFFIRDVHGEFGLLKVHLIDILPAVSSGKVGDLFCLESGNPLSSVSCVCLALLRSIGALALQASLTCC